MAALRASGLTSAGKFSRRAAAAAANSFDGLAAPVEKELLLRTKPCAKTYRKGSCGGNKNQWHSRNTCRPARGALGYRARLLGRRRLVEQSLSYCRKWLLHVKALAPSMVSAAAISQVHALVL